MEEAWGQAESALRAFGEARAGPEGGKVNIITGDIEIYYFMYSIGEFYILLDHLPLWIFLLNKFCSTIYVWAEEI